MSPWGDGASGPMKRGVDYTTPGMGCDCLCHEPDLSGVGALDHPNQPCPCGTTRKGKMKEQKHQANATVRQGDLAEQLERKAREIPSGDVKWLLQSAAIALRTRKELDAQVLSAPAVSRPEWAGADTFDLDQLADQARHASSPDYKGWAPWKSLKSEYQDIWREKVIREIRESLTMVEVLSAYARRHRAHDLQAGGFSRKDIADAVWRGYSADSIEETVKLVTEILFPDSPRKPCNCGVEHHTTVKNPQGTWTKCTNCTAFWIPAFETSSVQAGPGVAEIEQFHRNVAAAREPAVSTVTLERVMNEFSDFIIEVAEESKFHFPLLPSEMASRFRGRVEPLFTSLSDQRLV